MTVEISFLLFYLSSTQYRHGRRMKQKMVLLSKFLPNLCSLVNLSHFFGTKWIYRTHFFPFAESVMSSGDIDDNTAEERIQKLNRLYVEANKTAETDKSIEAIARSRFSRLEQGDQDLVRQVFSSLTKYFLYTLNLTI